MNLYHLAYRTNHDGDGVAAVTACNPNMAEQILKAQGILNGTPREYQVYKVTELACDYTGEPCILDELNTVYTTG